MIIIQLTVQSYSFNAYSLQIQNTIRCVYRAGMWNCTTPQILVLSFQWQSLRRYQVMLVLPCCLFSCCFLLSFSIFFILQLEFKANIQHSTLIELTLCCRHHMEPIPVIEHMKTFTSHWDWVDYY